MHLYTPTNLVRHGSELPLVRRRQANIVSDSISTRALLSSLIDPMMRHLATFNYLDQGVTTPQSFLVQPQTRCWELLPGSHDFHQKPGLPGSAWKHFIQQPTLLGHCSMTSAA